MKITVSGGWVDSVGDGWRSLVEPLLEEAEKRKLPVLQVKEKFGGLRFYYGGADDDFEQLVQAAEDASYRTCEDCGSTDNVDTKANSYWIRTICDACRNK